MRATAKTYLRRSREGGNPAAFMCALKLPTTLGPRLHGDDALVIQSRNTFDPNPHSFSSTSRDSASTLNNSPISAGLSKRCA